MAIVIVCMLAPYGVEVGQGGAGVTGIPHQSQQLLRFHPAPAVVNIAVNAFWQGNRQMGRSTCGFLAGMSAQD